MNWINENKFLAGFIAFMVVGVGALGFLLFGAFSDYSKYQADYNTKFRQLSELQGKKPYPNDPNLENYSKQREELNRVINEMVQNLSKLQFSIDPSVTPQTFQKNLQTAIADATAKAGAKTKLPDKFALGFDTYVNTLAVPAAAPTLDRQLKAVEFIVGELLDGSGVTSIKSIDRPQQLPEEKQGGKPSTALMSKSPIVVSFVADNSALRRILNDLVQTKKQFYIVRLISIGTDEGDKPLTKADAAKALTSAQGNTLSFVLGQEKVAVTLSLEIVNFNPPPSK